MWPSPGARADHLNIATCFNKERSDRTRATIDDSWNERPREKRKAEDVEETAPKVDSKSDSNIAVRP